MISKPIMQLKEVAEVLDIEDTDVIEILKPIK